MLWDYWTSWPAAPSRLHSRDKSVTAGRQDMRGFVPISVGGWDRLFSRWDILAVLLFPRGRKPPSVRAAGRPAAYAAVARSCQSARICRAHDAAHVHRHGAVA